MRQLLTEMENVMKFRFLYCIAVLIINIIYCAKIDAKIYRAVIGRVIDGDTIDVRDIKGKIFRIRMAGIDAPEMDQPGGFRAAECVRANLYDSCSDNVCLYLSPERYDRYHRLIATVYLWNGKNLCQHLVDRGWAWAYVRYTSRYIKDEYHARHAGRGIWGDNRPPMEPWQWRANKRIFDNEKCSRKTIPGSL